MAGLSPGRGAGVEQTLARFGFEQSGHELRSFVLHAQEAVGESRNLVHRPRLGEIHRCLRQFARRAVETFMPQGEHRLLAGNFARIDAQTHGRAVVVALKNRPPIFRPIHPDGLGEPARMVQADGLGLPRQPLVELGAPALMVAQHGIDQGLRPLLAQLPRGLHGQVDCRVVGHGEFAQLIQGAEQQVFQVGIALAQWPFEQLAEQVGKRFPLPANAITDLLQQTVFGHLPVGLQVFAERTAMARELG